jgi:hypothetical protein
MLRAGYANDSREQEMTVRASPSSLPILMSFVIGYIMASVDLAHEYVKLGKIRRASAIYNQSLSSVRSGSLSDETKVRYLLRYAESLVAADNVLQR